MRPGGSKAKGGSFERQVCKDLSLWLTRGRRNDIFWRSAMSGGRATVHQKGRKGRVRMAHVSGDICAVDPIGASFIDMFYIECKHYKDLGLMQLLMKSSGRLANFWLHTKTKAYAVKKLPMLIAKQNGVSTFCLLNNEGVGELEVIVDGPVFHQLDLAILNFDTMLKEADYARFNTDL